MQLIAADANKHRSIPGSNGKRRNPRREAEPCRSIWRHAGDAAFGAASDVTPKFVLAVRSRRTMDGRDARSGILRLRRQLSVDVKFGARHGRRGFARHPRQAEVGASPQTMIERTKACFGIKPAWLAADTAYGSARQPRLAGRQQRIAPHVPVVDKCSARTAPSRVRTSSPSTRYATPIHARRARPWPRLAMSAPIIRSGISPRCLSAAPARSKQSAAKRASATDQTRCE